MHIYGKALMQGINAYIYGKALMQGINERH